MARTVLPLDELLAVFSSLASASTPSAVLTTVVSGLGREFSRVALFRVRGSRLECVSHVGFEFEGDVAKVVIPTTVDSPDDARRELAQDPDVRHRNQRRAVRRAVRRHRPPAPSRSR